MNASKVVVDTNIFFSFLLRRRSTDRRSFLTDRSLIFHSPRFCLVELFKHKERIMQAAELAEEELLECLNELLAGLRFIEEGSIAIGTWMEARRLCRDIDLKDSPFVALTLHLDGRLWTDDEELKTGLRTIEMIEQPNRHRQWRHGHRGGEPTDQLGIVRQDQDHRRARQRDKGHVSKNVIHLRQSPKNQLQ